MLSGTRKDNRFERHAAKTVILTLIVFIPAIDFFSANIYKRIKGCPWALREQKQIQIKRREAYEFEKTYRVKSEIYHHDLGKNKFAACPAYTIYTNSLGFKDKVARNVPLTSDRYRIIFIGDSFTEGLNLSYGDTFVGLIDAELFKQGIEVLNAGVASYSPIIYWRKLKYLIEETGLKFNEVVVFLDISDVYDEAVSYRLDENGNVVKRDRKGPVKNNRSDNIKKENKARAVKTILRNQKNRLRNNSILIYSLFKLAHNAILTNGKNRHMAGSSKYAIGKKISLWTIDKNIYQEYGNQGLKRMKFYMDELYRLLKRHGIKLTVAVYPWQDQIINDDLDSIQVSFWRDWCRNNKTIFIGYYPYFVTGKTKKERKQVLDKYFIEGDMHWNKNGHRLVANVFLAYFYERFPTISGKYL